MSVLDRKLRRELISSWGVILAITSIMAIGIAAYVALNSAYRNLSRAQADYYDQCRMADFTLQLKKVPLSDIACLLIADVEAQELSWFGVQEIAELTAALGMKG